MTIYILLLLIAMQLIGVYFFQNLEDRFYENFRDNLEKQAGILQEVIKDKMTPGTESEKQRKAIDDILNKLPLDKKNTIQIVDQESVVIATTSGENSRIGQKNKSPRVSRVLQGIESPSVEVSHKAGNRYMVYSYPIKNDGDIIGAVYIEAPMQEMYDTIRTVSKILIKITAAAMVGTSLLGIILARTITNPVKEITEQATVMAEGDFNRKVTVKSDDEIGKLASAFNHLAQHLRDALSQNEEEKGRLQSVLANMSDGVIATDRKGKVIVSNRRARKMLGKDIELNEDINQVLPLANPISFPLTEERESFLELNRDEDETLILKLTFTPVLRASREAVGLILVLQDVTEEEKLDRQRKEFVANVSHELRTPLTTIKSYLEALDEGGAMEEPELASRFLRVTRQEAERMTRLIHDLLQLSKLDSEKVRFHKQPLRLEELLEDAADRFSFQCRQKDIAFSLSIRKPLPRVYADRDQIDRVLDNLLSNAVKYTPEGQSVSLSAHRRSDGYVEVVVSDKGIGIPKKDLDRIFERFYRVDKARSRSMGGTGLGLAIAREIVQAHGGTIRMDSRYGEGTTVRFTLPPCEPEVNPA
ncbi:two-component system sensor histidine kinase VicK [Melghirimyces profundicolus]|uniref:histidine kinase n=1 Tax=Melghirimyces profundicolus TaxID=1242148 RepID=A0A2T6C287_9BACL|nr:two-component system sensor histidine kinase VicK [Melghirimyces profundicolus]